MKSKSNTIFHLLFILIALLGCIEDDMGDLIDDRDAFLGTWNVSETCNRDAYSVQIVKDPSNSSQVLINNFWNTGNCGNSVSGIVAGNSIYITNKSFCNGDFTADGNGDLEKEEISWSYTVNDGADLYTCTATYTRP